MTLKKFLRRIMPAREWIQDHRHLQGFRGILQDPQIFHLTRRSAAGGVAAGLFTAFIPVPGQTLLALLFALMFRLNLPLAVLFSWTTNPVTMAPLFFLCYRLGSAILGRPPEPVDFEISLTWFGGTFIRIWPALFTGGLIIATLSALAGYAVIRLLWRLAVARKWARRRQAREGGVRSEE